MPNNFNQPESMSRRHFMRQAACAALGATAMVNTLSALRLTSAAIAQGTGQEDYKALVCIFLHGGNDSNNLLIPLGAPSSNSLRADYEKGRTVVALAEDTLHSLTMPTSTPAFNKYHGDTVSPLGIHPDAQPIAGLFNDGDLAFVCNVGTLSHPIPTRDDYINGVVPVPWDLFSHPHQQMQWQTSVSGSAAATGWGGRMARELLDAGYNGDESKVSISMSFGGANTFQRGISADTAAFALQGEGVVSLLGYGTEEEPYADAYHPGSNFAAPNYQNNQAGHRLKALESLLNLANDNLLEDAYATRLVSSRSASDSIDSAVALSSQSSVDFDQIFSNANHKLGDQLKSVAKLIAGRSELGNERQIFFVEAGGYDIHKNHLESHAELMTELSTGLAAFRDALVALNDWDKVVAYTASDFSRTFSPNSPDEDSGTDHAWGGHSMVMGGPVKGGQLYGHFPSLKMGDHPESIDAHKGRGRWIPSTSVDQYSSVMAKWFGVESSAMDVIFPNLGRFDDPVSTTLANLKFIEGM